MNRSTFGRLYPDEYRALQRVWNRKQDREDFRSASIQAILAEIHRDSDKRKEPFSAFDFFQPREMQRPQPAKVNEEKANQHAINMLRDMTAAMASVFGKVETSDEKVHDDN